MHRISRNLKTISLHEKIPDAAAIMNKTETVTLMFGFDLCKKFVGEKSNDFGCFNAFITSGTVT